MMSRPFLRLAAEALVALVFAAAVGAAAFLAPEPNTHLAAAARDFARFLILASMGFTGFRVLLALGVRRSWAAMAITVTALSLGVGVEVIEMSAGEEFSGGDVAMDLAGSLCGLAAAQWGAPAGRLGGRAVWSGVALVLLALAVLPFADVLQAYAERRAHFPVLLDARRDADLFWVRKMPVPVRLGSVDPALRREVGEPAFEVSFEQGELPGLAVDEPYGDWSGFDTLSIDLINPGDTPLDLILNVDDMRGSGKPGDRYDERVQLAPRSRRVLRTPLAAMVKAIPHRRFALEDMDIVMIYRLGPAAGEQLLVRRIWLE